MFSQLDFFTVVMSIIAFVSIILTLALTVVYSSKQELRLLKEKHEVESHLQEAKKSVLIGALAGGMAFYLTNILQTIEDHVNLLKAGGNMADLVNLPDLITGEIKKALIVSDRLYLITHPTEIELQLMSFTDLLASMKGWIADQLPDSVEIRTDFRQGNNMIIGNQTLLWPALQSIITNAAEAMTDGGTLTINLSNVDGVEVDEESTKGESLVVSISDTGCGMDEDTKHRAFEPFFTTKSGFDRLGLGLSLLYGILKIHRAKYEVESEVNQGTTIRLFFPVASEDEIKNFTAGDVIGWFPAKGSREQRVPMDAIVGKA